MRRLTLLITLCITLAIPGFLYAEKTHIPDSSPSLGRGIRPLGMGNAFTAAEGSDYNSLFYNPASQFDRSENLEWTTAFPLIPFEMSTSVIGLIQDIFDLNDDLKNASTDSQKIDIFETFTNDHAGEFNSLFVQLPLVGVGNKYFSAMITGNSRTTISLRNRAFPNFEIKHRDQGGLVLGGAYGILHEDLQLGLALKFLYAFEMEQIITTNEIITGDIGDNLPKNRGFGVGVDVGIKYDIPDTGIDFLDELEPAVSVVWQDIADTRFQGGVSRIPQSISAGFGLFPTFGNYDIAFLVDFRDINRRMDIEKKLHAGVEVWFPKIAGTKFALRAGCNQLYPAVGVGAKWRFLTWNFAFYGEEMGETTRQKADYRIANEVVFTF
jgi:hypothetical protein